MHYTMWKVSVFGVILVHIFPHSDWIRRDTVHLSPISPYSVRMRENKDQNNSEYGQFLHSDRKADLSSIFPQTISRSSRPEVFCEKGILRNFAKFTGKHKCQSLFFNKVASFRFLIISGSMVRNQWHEMG